MQLGRSHVLLGPEHHGSSAEGRDFEADMAAFVVVLVYKVVVAGDVVEFWGWPGGILSVLCG